MSATELKTACSVFIFRDVEQARAYNDAHGMSFDPTIGMSIDFRELPFAINPPPGSPPPEEQIVSRHDGYPVDYAAILRGMDFLLRNGGVDALNLSLGPEGFEFDQDDPLQVATRHVHERGTTVVVAAGNDGPGEGTLQPLAQAPWVVAVGATDFGKKLLESSSRGWRHGPKPTVVSFGHPMVVYIGLPEMAPGTSFAAPRVANLAMLLSKVLELLLGNWRDATGTRWGTESRPIKLAKIGIADTGLDPRVPGDVMPEPVRAVLEAGGEHLTLPRTDRERTWLAAVRQRFGDAIGMPETVSATMVKEALKTIAEPIPDRAPFETGSGFIDRPAVVGFLSRMVPSDFLRLMAPRACEAVSLKKLRQLDKDLGALWDTSYVVHLFECFYFGRQLHVAKVVR